MAAQPVCDFKSAFPVGGSAPAAAAEHTHDATPHSHSHDHAVEHGHTHEAMEHAGKFAERDVPDFTGRKWNERAFTVGIGG